MYEMKMNTIEKIVYLVFERVYYVVYRVAEGGRDPGVDATLYQFDMKTVI